MGHEYCGIVIDPDDREDLKEGASLVVVSETNEARGKKVCRTWSCR